MWSRVWDLSEVEPFRESDLSGSDFGLGTLLVVSLGQDFRFIHYLA